MRLPIADSFGHILVANSEFTTTTGIAAFVSDVAMSRPARRAIPIVPKYCGVIVLVCTDGASPGLTGGRPSMVNGYDSPLPVNGNARTSAADSMPGTDRISVIVRSNIAQILSGVSYFTAGRRNCIVMRF